MIELWYIRPTRDLAVSLRVIKKFNIDYPSLKDDIRETECIDSLQTEVDRRIVSDKNTPVVVTSDVYFHIVYMLQEVLDLTGDNERVSSALHDVRESSSRTYREDNVLNSI
jgi:hypothetical protein